MLVGWLGTVVLLEFWVVAIIYSEQFFGFVSRDGNENEVAAWE